MPRFLIVILLSIAQCFIFSANAQFEIGHTTITFNDPERTGGFGSGGGPGRQIQTEIYYPADIAGDDVAIADGDFPVIVFGHGFVMVWSAYANIWEFMVPEGFIMAFPRTEGGFAPSHGDFGLDLALVATRMQELNELPGNIFSGSVSDATCIMGHSMGGGATMIAAANFDAQAVVGLASAETNPSAISAAEMSDSPFLIFSGGGDGVTPPEEHQIPIFNSSASSCKYHITISGGGHCYFANSNTNCDFGELFTSGGITVSRTEQQQTMNDYLLPWLNRWLKNDQDAYQEFLDLAFTDPRITYTEQCFSTSAADASDETPISLFPNPVSDVLFLQNTENIVLHSAIIYDAAGRIVFIREMNTAKEINVNSLPGGIYHLLLDGENFSRFFRFVKE